jgi:tripartite-type tricarboxylate transporter receptor subunit TctC
LEAKRFCFLAELPTLAEMGFAVAFVFAVSLMTENSQHLL